ncbi:MAG TPA: YCF48-related protein [Candidatus Sulfotelmatobacter sp.]|nr:YCF48-related protein [Candidatus Sulfotelmatobacter sp.]
MPTDDRDQQFERALGRHLRNASPDSNCPDAETLAAYHERTVSLEEMARWKEHIAGCARCQETLALVEQSEDVRAEELQEQNVPAPVLEEMSRPATLRAASVDLSHAEPALEAGRAKEAAAFGKAPSRLRWRWVVPIGALAASLIVWVGVREVQIQHRNTAQSVQMAKNQQPTPPLPAPKFEATDQLRKEEAPSRKLDEAAPVLKKVVPPPAKTVAPEMKEAPLIAAAPQPPANQSALSNQKGLEARSALTAPMPQARRSVSSDAAKSRERELAAQSPPVAGVTGGVVAKVPAEDTKKAQAYQSTQVVTVESQAAPLNTTSPEIQVQASEVANLLEVAAADRRYIVAPGEKYAWRVGDAGKIERSTDRGKSWKPQKSGVTADLTAGSATSDKICWVVGKAGTILLSTDSGKHWRQISSPITGDLGGVHATNAMHASIWDVPNRNSFETNDGGATWKPIANE